MHRINIKLSFILFFISIFCFSQNKDDYISLLVPTELKENANAVVRYDSQIIEINDFDDMKVQTKRIVTVYNKYGDKHINAVEFYDDNTSIKNLEVKIYDQLGEEIKKIKEKDFSDQSAVSGGTLYSDSRLKYYDYKPVNYPYTIEYTSEVKYKSTAFVPQWRPINGYYLAVQHSEYKINNNSGIDLRKKLNTNGEFVINEVSNDHYVIKNASGIKYEAYSPPLSEVTPLLKVAMTSFSMEGVSGINNNWQDFGKWMYDKLLTGTDDLPEQVITEVKSLTKGVDDKIERAKIVYKYLQDKTRYISVQVGIGGWQPIVAEEVDRLGYGDCKGLSNYTKALLEAVDVPSYYTVVYGGSDIRSLDSEFSVTEGNHVILCVPNNDENIFLECTSQTNPFGFTAGFTDDRDVLIVKPEGGEITHTKIYNADESLQKTDATLFIDEKGGITADVSVTTTGYQYNIHEGIQNETVRDQKLHYKEYWDNINNLLIEAITISNDRDRVIFNEKISISAKKYASKSGNRLIVQPNVFNKVTTIPQRYPDRKLGFEIERAFKDVDEFIIEMPSNLQIEAMSEGENLDTKFGSYFYKLEKIDDSKIKFTRQYILNKGTYDKSEYSAFRDFMKSIVKFDKTKIVLVKTN
jgi:transglutaminase-like putative cysteine protease